MLNFIPFSTIQPVGEIFSARSGPATDCRMHTFYWGDWHRLDGTGV
jgi:hypothetical protein